jgi:hypothetical protein
MIRSTTERVPGYIAEHIDEETRRQMEANAARYTAAG